MEEVEIDLNKAADIAEEMMKGIQYETLSMIDISSSLAIIIGALSENRNMDSMLIIQNIENIVNTLETL